MNILVLGCGGMLGHLVFLYLHKNLGDRVIPVGLRRTSIDKIDDKIELINLSDFSVVKKLISNYRPCIVINCSAIHNHSETSLNDLISINQDLPIFITNELSRDKDSSQLIQISSDGVFSGTRGFYSEKDIPDPNDRYGQSKLLGEITSPPNLTIRTSIIGHEITRKSHLLEWFLASNTAVNGYQNQFWSGVTTLQLAIFLLECINLRYSGLVHYCSERLSKYDLLLLIKKAYQLKIDINPIDSNFCDRSLISTRSDIAQIKPTLLSQLTELADWQSKNLD